MPQTIDAGLFTITINADKAIADLNSFKNQLTSAELLDKIGEAGVKIVQDLLDPISRSNTTKNSFSYKLDGASVVIFSDLDSAKYIAEGFAEAPSAATLMEWMNYKSEFAGLSEPEAKRIAFAIRKAIENNQAPGPGSTLGHLQPVGERKYDYIKLATDQISKMVETKVTEYLNTLGASE